MYDCILHWVVLISDIGHKNTVLYSCNVWWFCIRIVSLFGINSVAGLWQIHEGRTICYIFILLVAVFNGLETRFVTI